MKIRPLARTACLVLSFSAIAQPAPPTPAVDGLRAESSKLRPVYESTLARAFLDATSSLTEPTAREIYRNKDRSLVVGRQEYRDLPEDRREGLERRDVSPEMYFSTMYGSPLVYGRVLDIAARHGMTSLSGKRVLDFGYGSIGQLRLMAQLGADAVGVDVDPMLAAIYSEPGDTGPTPDGRGHVEIHTGRWPAEPDLVRAVGGGYDLITSKNTLKAGYIHPNPPPGKTVNERQLVRLGVDDAAFLRAVHGALRPGGLFIIFNISPAQSPADDPTKPYIPWADGASPFTRGQFEEAGFEVLEFDATDDDAIFRVWGALGYDEGKSAGSLAGSLFTHYTAARRR